MQWNEEVESVSGVICDGRPVKNSKPLFMCLCFRVFAVFNAGRTI